MSLLTVYTKDTYMNRSTTLLWHDIEELIPVEHTSLLCLLHIEELVGRGKLGELAVRRTIS